MGSQCSPRLAACACLHGPGHVISSTAQHTEVYALDHPPSPRHPVHRRVHRNHLGLRTKAAAYTESL